jgi:hypothetical protein
MEQNMTNIAEVEAKLDVVTALVDQLFGEVAHCIIIGFPDGMIHYVHNLPAGLMADLLRGTADQEEARQTKAGEAKEDEAGQGDRDQIG